ncbi:MAG TPA: potassium channel family protein [Chthonomonadaceae bacterium]|nr:potassium channel family protein [Chthonomonadaceae bacterium]
MKILAVIFGVLLLVVILWEALEVLVLPRTVTRRFRLTRYFYIISWGFWSWMVTHLIRKRAQDRALGIYGPTSLLFLLVFWVLCLIFAFALIQWGLGSQIVFNTVKAGSSFYPDLYLSSTTFFTMGFGDITPVTALSRTISVIEAGVGFGFLAIVISYLPVLYQSFSRREVGISRLDARAGSPPSAGELLRRHAYGKRMEELTPLLDDWERWSADVLESHLSYPVLAYYRSQHDRESWLSALTAILDTCVLVSLRFDKTPEWQDRLLWQAKLTFAMARHTIVDLCLVLKIEPTAPQQNRLPEEEFARLCSVLTAHGIPLQANDRSYAILAEKRRQYEPYVNGLAKRLLLELPPWLPQTETPDNWQVTAWDDIAHF